MPNAINAKRRAYKINQTPTNADMEKIAEIYATCIQMSKDTGIPHHVDHIQPLSKGGLHHEDNLQILTATENRKKHDKWEV